MSFIVGNTMASFVRADIQLPNSDKKCQQEIKITDRNIKIINGRFHIHKYFKGINIRISTDLKATNENLGILKQEFHKYIHRNLVEKGYIFDCINNNRYPNEYLHESISYFLNDIRTQIKDSSFEKYKSFLQQIQKKYPHQKTLDTNTEFLHNLAIQLNAKALSKSDIKFKIRTLVRVVNDLRQYLGTTLIDTKALKIKNLGKQKKEILIFNEQELRAILQVETSREVANYLKIACYTGARVSEILSLTKQDINLQENYINITKTKNYNGNITSPKTKSSYRKIPLINEDFKLFLQELLKETKTDHIFTITSSFLRQEWKKILKTLNLKKRPIYNLRHSFATLAIQKTGNILGVSKILGHSNANITLGIYASNNIDLQNILFKI